MDRDEAEIEEIMRRFSVTREVALTAPPRILEIIPEVQPPLSEAEVEYGREVLRRLVDGGPR